MGRNSTLNYAGTHTKKAWMGHNATITLDFQDNQKVTLMHKVEYLSCVLLSSHFVPKRIAIEPPSTYPLQQACEAPSVTCCSIPSSRPKKKCHMNNITTILCNIVAEMHITLGMFCNCFKAWATNYSTTNSSHCMPMMPHANTNCPVVAVICSQIRLLASQLLLHTRQKDSNRWLTGIRFSGLAIVCSIRVCLLS